MNLFEIKKEFNSLYEMCDLSQDEDIDTIKDLFDDLQETLGEKLDGCAAVLRQLKADQETIKAEEQRLAQKRKTIEANETRLKELMLEAIKTTGDTKLKTLTNSFSLRVSESVVILDEKVLPAEVKEVVETTKIDKKLLKELMKEGDINGAMIETNLSLQIR
jgi:ABC-type transporter Mla subunit MlaD